MTTRQAIRFFLVQKLIFRNLMFVGMTAIVSVLLEVTRMDTECDCEGWAQYLCYRVPETRNGSSHGDMESILD